MRCQECGFDNEEREIYCRNCGVKIIYTYEEVHEALDVKLRTSKAEELEKQVRHILVVCVVLFILAITFKVVFSGWDKAIAVPTNSQSASYATYQFTIDTEMEINKRKPLKPEKLKIPIRKPPEKGK